jgi:hypothetical protein
VNKQLASHEGEIDAQRWAMSIEMLDSVQTIIGERLWKPSWSRAALGKGGKMSKRDSGRLFIRVVCTDMYIDRQTGVRCARHQQFRLARLPVFVEKDQDGNALPGSESVGYRPDAHVNPRTPARRCPKCGRPFPGAARSPDEGGVWSRIVRRWLHAEPKCSVLVVDISDPAYSW